MAGISFTPQEKNSAAMALLWASAVCIILALCAIVVYVFYRGFHELGIGFLVDSPRNLWLEGGIFPALLGTMYIVLIALLFATPLGAGAAVYLSQYTKEGFITKIIRVGSDSLNAIPSIVFGLFGLG